MSDYVPRHGDAFDQPEQPFIEEHVPLWRRPGFVLSGITLALVAPIVGLFVRSEMKMRAPSDVPGTIAVSCDDIGVARTCVRLVKDAETGKVRAMGEVESRTWHTEGGYHSYRRVYDDQNLSYGDLTVRGPSGATSYHGATAMQTQLTSAIPAIVSDPAMAVTDGSPVQADFDGFVYRDGAWKQMHATVSTRVDTSALGADPGAAPAPAVAAPASGRSARDSADAGLVRSFGLA